MKKIIKVMKFDSFVENEGYNEFWIWQKNNPHIKILDTNIILEPRTYVEKKLLITYEEEEK